MVPEGSWRAGTGSFPDLNHRQAVRAQSESFMADMDDEKNLGSCQPLGLSACLMLRIHSLSRGRVRKVAWLTLKTAGVEL